MTFVAGLLVALGAGPASAVPPSSGEVLGWGPLQSTFGAVPGSLGSDIRAVATGGWANLALTASGTVRAWGDNAYGQLDVPAGLTDVTALSVGSRHALALRNDNTVVS